MKNRTKIRRRKLKEKPVELLSKSEFYEKLRKKMKEIDSPEFREARVRKDKTLEDYRETVFLRTRPFEVLFKFKDWAESEIEELKLAAIPA